MNEYVPHPSPAPNRRSTRRVMVLIISIAAVVGAAAMKIGTDGPAVPSRRSPAASSATANTEPRNAFVEGLPDRIPVAGAEAVGGTVSKDDMYPGVPPDFDPGLTLRQRSVRVLGSDGRPVGWFVPDHGYVPDATADDFFRANP